MNTPTQSSTPDERNEIHSELFAQMVMQQAGLAMMFLGVTPHPQTGKKLFDLDGLVVADEQRDAQSDSHQHQ